MYFEQWPLIPPDVNNKTRRENDQPEHALPSWARITCGDRQSNKIRGESGKAMKRDREEEDGFYL